MLWRRLGLCIFRLLDHGYFFRAYPDVIAALQLQAYRIRAAGVLGHKKAFVFAASCADGYPVADRSFAYQFLRFRRIIHSLTMPRENIKTAAPASGNSPLCQSSLKRATKYSVAGPVMMTPTSRFFSAEFSFQFMLETSAALSAMAPLLWISKSDILDAMPSGFRYSSV